MTIRVAVFRFGSLTLNVLLIRLLKFEVVVYNKSKFFRNTLVYMQKVCCTRMGGYLATHYRGAGCKERIALTDSKSITMFSKAPESTTNAKLSPMQQPVLFYIPVY